MLRRFADRLLQLRLQRDEKRFSIAITFVASLLVLILVNIFYLNVTLVNSIRSPKTTSAVATQEQTPSPQAEITDSPVPTVPVKTQTESAGTMKQSVLQETFVPLGSGNSSATEWTDVPGAEAYIDFGKYSLKEARFEASLYVPNANQFVEVRLYNANDKHPVWNSEMKMDSGSSALLMSSPLGVNGGLKLYRVQIRTQLGSQTNLVQARVRIVTE